ncbi:MAG: sigma-70 family RNA polymerase sigma factor, partial [Thermoleophilaceae bacterium]
MSERGIRPERAEIDAAALELLARHGSQILATARRYAATPEDAEDACQRGLEILLTKAPSTSEEDLIPWLKTVVKHEAFALRRQRERHSPVTDDGELRDRPAIAGVTHEQAERLERLRQGAEALGHLKPHEIRALVLKAEGFSYREICAMTGWSYTKVNRLLTEGRRAFLRRVSGIERGADCAQYEPLLSALADGEASAEDLAALRPHMRTCLSCRAALREFRATPGRVASVVPAAVLATGDHGSPIRGFMESLVGAAQHKTAALGDRLHAATELAIGQKVAVVAASAAALAGGGTALDEFANHDLAARAAQVAQDPPPEPPADAPGDPSVPLPAPPDTTSETPA